MKTKKFTERRHIHTKQEVVRVNSITPGQRVATEFGTGTIIELNQRSSIQKKADAWRRAGFRILAVYEVRLDRKTNVAGFVTRNVFIGDTLCKLLND